MGLDMYLNGSKYRSSSADKQEEDGFKVKETVLELGYWRKHPNLHGFIVNQFAGGIDECQDIELSKENILEIINAIKSGSLPHTEGFFFGNSSNSQEQATEDVAVFEKALKWLDSEENGIWKSVIYSASW